MQSQCCLSRKLQSVPSVAYRSVAVVWLVGVVGMSAALVA